MPLEAAQCSVLHVIAHMDKAGAERQMMLLTHTSRHRHVIAVLEGNEAPSDVPVVLLPSLDPRAIYRRIRNAIEEHGIDIVQLWLPDRITIPAMIAARRAGCRIISGDRRRVRNYGRGAIRDRVPYVNHIAADVVIPNYPHFPPGLSLRRVMGIPRKTLTIPNGLQLSPQNRSIPGTPNRLLFVGRLVEQKRVGMLVGAMPRILQDTCIEGLDIVGEGPEAEAITSAISDLGLERQIRLHGRLTDWGSRFDPATHMLVLPSASEGMSNTLFEAIAWGFLPITSRSPELEETLRAWPQKPVMIDHRDPETIVVALRQVCAAAHGEIETRVRNMQARLEDFSVLGMAEAYDLVYDRLMAGKDMSGAC